MLQLLFVFLLSPAFGGTWTESADGSGTASGATKQEARKAACKNARFEARQQISCKRKGGTVADRNFQCTCSFKGSFEASCNATLTFTCEKPDAPPAQGGAGPDKTPDPGQKDPTHKKPGNNAPDKPAGTPLPNKRTADGSLPLEERPRTLQADNKDRFYIDYGKRVVRWTTRRDRIYKYRPPQGYTMTRPIHIVAKPKGTIHSLVHSSKSECVDKECKTRITHYQIDRWRCPDVGECKKTKIANWRRRTGDKSYTTYDAMHRVTDAGTLLLKVSKTQVTPDNSKTTTNYTCGGEKCMQKRWENLYFKEMSPTPTYRIHEGKKTFYGGELGDPKGKISLGGKLLELMANVDTTFIYDGAGRPHIFHHNKKRKLIHSYVDESGTPQRVNVQVDGPESGAANAAVRMGSAGLIAFHYFYRNSYYKGVKATFWDNATGEPTWSIDLDNSRDGNPGWHLQAASTPQGRVLVGYTRDARHDKRYRLRLFSDKQALKAAAVEQPTGWERNHKTWFGLVGAGAGYAMWQFASGQPDSEDFADVPDSAQYLIDSSYDVAPSIMVSATAEARFGPFSLGGSYARGQVKDAVVDAGGESAGATFDRLYGQLGLDQIIKYHDIRIAIRAGRVSMNYDLEAPGSLPRDKRTALGFIESDYNRFDVYLLNTWRVRYGFFHQEYQAYMPFYTWHINEGDTEYSFVDSFSAETRFSDNGITVGYSQLDYAAKFENKVNRFFIDGDAGLGWSTAILEEPHTVTLVDADGNETPEEIDRVGAILVPFNLETGFIIMRRNYKLRGLGWYSRLGYRTEGSWAGGSAKPGDKEEPAESDVTSTGFDRFELRHGPFFDAGMVF